MLTKLGLGVAGAGFEKTHPFVDQLLAGADVDERLSR